MSMMITLALMAALIGLTVLSGWMGARPRDFTRPRLVPWPFLMMLSAAAAMMMAVHALNLVGVTTGGNSAV